MHYIIYKDKHGAFLGGVISKKSVKKPNCEEVSQAEFIEAMKVNGYPVPPLAAEETKTNVPKTKEPTIKEGTEE